MKLVSYAGGVSFPSFGFGVSDGTKIMYYGPSYNNVHGAGFTLWNSPTSYNSDITSTFPIAVAGKLGPYYRIQKVSSSSYIFSHSQDGISWNSHASYNMGAFMTPTTIGAFGLPSAQFYAMELSVHWYRHRAAKL
jgi:hypothetical protein